MKTEAIELGGCLLSEIGVEKQVKELHDLAFTIIFVVFKEIQVIIVNFFFLEFRRRTANDAFEILNKGLDRVVSDILCDFFNREIGVCYQIFSLFDAGLVDKRMNGNVQIATEHFLQIRLGDLQIIRDVFYAQILIIIGLYIRNGFFNVYVLSRSKVGFFGAF